MGAPDWRSVFRQIQAAGLIALQGGDEGDDSGERWSVTEAGRSVLTGAQPFRLVSPTEAAGSGRVARRSADTARAGDRDDSDDGALTTGQTRLFAALKAMRLEQARARKVPAYVVLTDRSLRAIARAQPSDAAALGRIHGVGPAKVETYGAMVLGVVAGHAME